MAELFPDEDEALRDAVLVETEEATQSPFVQDSSVPGLDQSIADEFSREPDPRTSLLQSAHQSQSVDPEARIRALVIENETNIPYATAEAAPERTMAQLQLQQLDIEEITRFPALKSALEDPRIAPIAFQEVDNLLDHMRGIPLERKLAEPEPTGTVGDVVSGNLESGWQMIRQAHLVEGYVAHLRGGEGAATAAEVAEFDFNRRNAPLVPQVDGLWLFDDAIGLYAQQSLVLKEVAGAAIEGGVKGASVASSVGGTAGLVVGAVFPVAGPATPVVAGWGGIVTGGMFGWTWGSRGGAFKAGRDLEYAAILGELLNYAEDLKAETGEEIDLEYILGMAKMAGNVSGTIEALGVGVIARLFGSPVKTFLRSLYKERVRDMIRETYHTPMRQLAKQFATRTIAGGLAEGAPEWSQEYVAATVLNIMLESTETGLGSDLAAGEGLSEAQRERGQIPGGIAFQGLDGPEAVQFPRIPGFPTPAQFMGRMFEAGVAGTVVGGTLGGASSAWVVGKKKIQQVNHARRMAKSLDEVAEASKQSALRVAVPDDYHRLMEARERESGHRTDIGIDVGVFTKFFQEEGISLEELRDKIPEVIAQIPAAAARGGELVISLADYLTHIAPDYHKDLRRDVRARVGDLNLRDGERIEGASERAKITKAMREEAGANVKPLGPLEQAADREEQRMLERLIAAGRHSPQSAKDTARFWRAVILQRLTQGEFIPDVQVVGDPTRGPGKRLPQPQLAELLADQNMADMLEQLRSGAEPELRGLQRFPILQRLKALGGVKPTVDGKGNPTLLHAALVKMGFTPRNVPGLYQEDGWESVDALQELADQGDPIFDARGTEEDGSVGPRDIMSMIREELFGNPSRTDAEQRDIDAVAEPRNELERELARVGITREMLFTMNNQQVREALEVIMEGTDGVDLEVEGLHELGEEVLIPLAPPSAEATAARGELIALEGGRETLDNLEAEGLEGDHARLARIILSDQREREREQATAQEQAEAQESAQVGAADPLQRLNPLRVFTQAARRLGLQAAVRRVDDHDQVFVGENHGIALLNAGIDVFGTNAREMAEWDQGFVSAGGVWYSREEAAEAIGAINDRLLSEQLDEQGDLRAASLEELAELALDSDSVFSSSTDRFLQEPLVDRIPGLKGVLPDLTPAERDRLREQEAGSLVDIFGALIENEGASGLASVAFAGRVQRGWYRDSAETILRIFGIDDAPRFTGLLAALSPRISVEESAENALRVWTQWVSEDRPTDRADINRIMDDAGVRLQGAKLNNVVTILQSEDPTSVALSGDKVNSFMLNLRNFVDEVTNDAWMGTLLGLKEVAQSLGLHNPRGGPRDLLDSRTGYLAVSALTRRAARILSNRTGETWTPRDVQAAAWSWARSLSNKAKRDKDRTALQIMQQEGISDDEIRAGSDSFAKLFTNGIYRQILEEGGLGEEVEEVARRRKRNASRDRTRRAEVAAQGPGVATESHERNLRRAAIRLDISLQRTADAGRATRAQSAARRSSPAGVRFEQAERAVAEQSGEGTLARIRRLSIQARNFRESRIRRTRFDPNADISDILERSKPINDELERLTGHPQGLADPDTRRRLEEAPPGREPALAEAAVAHFGVTEDFREAGYILPDGRMLDFSGKNDGGTPGRRNLDHRDINILDAIDGDQTEGMVEWMTRSGAVRFGPETGFVEAVGKITTAQARTIADSAIALNVDFLLMDSTGFDGRNVASDELSNMKPGAIKAFFDANAVFFQPDRSPQGDERRSRAIDAFNGKRQSAFHGSAVDFLKFLTAFIGTGRGGAAFGWGLYFAQLQEVAEFYRALKAGRNNLVFRGENIAGVVHLDARDVMHDLGVTEEVAELLQFIDFFEGNVSGVASALAEQLDELDAVLDDDTQTSQNKRRVQRLKPDVERQIELLNELGGEVQVDPQAGQIFEVEIPSNENLMDWDRALQDMTPEVRALLAPVLRELDVPGDANGEAIYKALVLEYGSEQGASEALARAGILGHSYRDSESLDKPPELATSNFVIYDDAAISIVNKFFQEEGKRGKGPRGSLEISEDLQTVIIRMTESADLTTFLHESGHLFLELLRNDATRPGASNLAVRNLAAAQRWWRGNRDSLLQEANRVAFTAYTDRNAARPEGEAVPVFEPVTLLDIDDAINQGAGPGSHVHARTALHEQWARAFELYLREGVSPSIYLREVFRTFKGWLFSTYADADALGVNLNDELRQVFDTLLAGQEAIDQVRREDRFLPVWSSLETAEHAGITRAEFESINRLGLDARRIHEEGLDKKLMRNLRRLFGETHKKNEQDVREGVEREFNTNRVYRLKHWLATGEMLDGTAMPLEHRRLDGPAMRRAVADRNITNVGAFRARGRFALWQATGGHHPEVIKDAFGFKSVAQMLELLAESPHRETAIAAEVKARMFERYGDPQSDGRMAELAAEAAENDAEGRWHLEHHRVFARNAGTDPTPLRFIKDAAIRITAETVVEDLRPWVHRTTSDRWARVAAEAAHRRDWAEAADAKLKQVLNHYLSVENEKARQVAETDRAFSVRFRTRPKRQQMAKAGKHFLEATDRIMVRFGFSKLTQKQLAQKIAVGEWIRIVESQGLLTQISKEARDETLSKHWSKLTFEELHGVADSLRNIDHIARAEQNLITARETQDFLAARDAMVAAINANRPSDPPPEKGGIGHPSGKAAGILLNINAWHTKMEWLFERLDGFNERGVVWQLLFKPFVEAENVEAERMKAVAKRFNAIFRGVSKANRVERRTQKVFIREIGEELTRDEILSVLLNMGNAHNRSALNHGRGQKWSSAQLQAIVSHVSLAEHNAAKEIWAFLHEFWPEVKALAERTSGLAPSEVEGIDVVTPHGTLKGGYYPLAADPEATFRAFALNERNTAQHLYENQWASAMTAHGHEKERKDFGENKVYLSMDVLSQHVHNVVHDLTHREALINANKLIVDDKVREAMEASVGKEQYRQLKPWLQGIAGDFRPPDWAYDKILRHARAGVTISYMGYKITTTLAQYAGILPAIDRVGLLPMMKVYSLWFMNHKLWEQQKKEALAASAFLRNRRQNFDREARDLVRRGALTRTAAGHISQDVQNSFLYMVGMADMHVSVPTWMAAYGKEMDANGGDSVAAIEAADQAVRFSQGTGSVKDLAASQRGGELLKMFTPFYTYFATFYNQAQARGIQTKRGLLSQTGGISLPQAAASAAWIWFGPAYISEIVALRFPDEWDDPEEWAKWLAREGIKYPFLGMVFIRDIANFTMNEIQGKPFDFSPVPAFDQIAKTATAFVEVGDDIINLRAPDKTTNRAVFDAITFWGLLPQRQMWITLEFIYDLITEDDVHFQDAFFPKPISRRGRSGRRGSNSGFGSSL